MIRFRWGTAIAALLFFGFISSKCNNTTQSGVPSASIVRSAQSEQASPQKYSAEQHSSAQKVMSLVRQDCKIYEEGPHLVVEMKMYMPDQNKRLAYVRAIADSDCILNGSPRNIYFYDPSGKQIAQADTLNGVRLKD